MEEEAIKYLKISLPHSYVDELMDDVSDHLIDQEQSHVCQEDPGVRLMKKGLDQQQEHPPPSPKPLSY